MRSAKIPDNFRPELHDQRYREQLKRAAAEPASLIVDAGRTRYSLDGSWHFSPDPFDTCLRSRWWAEDLPAESDRVMPWDYDYEAWESVTVPSCWNMVSETYRLYEGPAVYTRTFSYISNPGQRTFLRFGAAYHDIAVFLNRQLVGYHEGGDTPFNFEVTSIVRPENRIVCVVNNARRTDRVPTDAMDWYNYGGLYRSIDLLTVPTGFIRDYQVYLVPDTNFGQIRVVVDVDGSAEAEAALTIPDLDINVAIPLSDGHGEATIDARPELWSPETPRLYEVKLFFGMDEVCDRIGFREIRVDGMEILLNGTPILLNGVSCHEESVTGGKTLSDAEIRENLSLVKELNGNFIRLAHYPHSDRTARMADEMGVMIWAEIPVYWAVDFANPATLSNARDQLEELIRRDRNRASVVLWSVGNENPDTDERLSFMSNLIGLARELDPTRLVTAACLWDDLHSKIQDRLTAYLDVIGVNEYYGWYNPDLDELANFLANSEPDKPVILTEFGGGAVAGYHGPKTQLFTEERQEFIYQTQTELIGRSSFVKGTSPWILYDFRAMRRLNRHQKGYNRKGLLNEDKTRRKRAFFVLQDFYSGRTI